jgi:drug/metabolite transporter (DMT)-like permease
MLKTFLLVLVAVVLGGAGHVMLSKGMKPIGDITEAPSSRIGGMVWGAVTDPRVLAGVALQAIFFFVYLAQWALGEVITPARWAGIGLITVGVVLVSRT